MLEWKKFTEELPEEERMVIMGDHNFVEVYRYRDRSPFVEKMKTLGCQWAYFNPPEKLS